jgi:hypothetical protein
MKSSDLMFGVLLILYGLALFGISSWIFPALYTAGLNSIGVIMFMISFGILFTGFYYLFDKSRSPS